MESPKPARIQILQVVRLFAASMIILYHTDLIGSRGSFGVEVFFVLSGFLAVYTTSRPVRAGSYLLKRLIRLLPLYWIFTVLTFLILNLKPGISNMSDEDPLHFLYSMLFIPYVGRTNLVLPILAVGWTVNFELAFSLLFALSLLISHRHRVLVCSLLLLALVAAGLLIKPEPLFIKYYTDVLFFDFFLGVAAGWLWERLRRSVPDGRPVLSGLPAPLRIPVSVLLAALSLFCVWFLVTNGRFPVKMHVAFRFGFPAVVLVLSLLLLLEQTRFPPLVLSLGEMTYSVYLVEYFTTSVYKRLVPEGIGLPLRVLSLLLLFAVTFALSVIPYRLIEVRLSSRLRRLCLPSGDKKGC